MGSDTHYPEERPAYERTVAPFAIERHPVTNARSPSSSTPPAT